MEGIFEELVDSHKDICEDLVKLVFDEKYNFLFINTDSQHMFKNWDSIEF